MNVPPCNSYVKDPQINTKMCGLLEGIRYWKHDPKNGKCQHNRDPMALACLGLMQKNHDFNVRQGHIVRWKRKREREYENAFMCLMWTKQKECCQWKTGTPYIDLKNSSS